MKAFTLKGLVLIRLKGVLTPAERQLANNADGIEMVKAMRQNLIAQGCEKLSSQLSEITGTTVPGVFTDIDAQIGECVIVFSLNLYLGNCLQ